MSESDRGAKQLPATSAGSPVDRKTSIAKSRRFAGLAVVFVAIGLVLLMGSCALNMPGRSYSGPLEPLTAEQTVLRDRLKAHVEHLAGEIGVRNVGRPTALEKAAVFVEAAFQEAGYEVERQLFQVEGVMVCNLIAERRGTGTDAEEIVVIGAHYDSIPGSPAANDNASGVAGVLEIARLLRQSTPKCTLRFVVFVNEEPPFFQTDNMGSLRYARRCRERGEKIVAMLSLETIGYYDDERRSQRYPFPLSKFYPDTGNFVAFVGNLGSRSLTRRVVGSFRRHAKFPSEGAAIPGWIRGVGWSDHWSFWKAKYNAVMITDTAPFRYPYYHSSLDTPDKIDYGRMARVVDGLTDVVTELSKGERPRNLLSSRGRSD